MTAPILAAAVNENNRNTTPMITVLRSPWPEYLWPVLIVGGLLVWARYSYNESGPSMDVTLKICAALLVGPIGLMQIATSTVELEQTTIRWTTGFPWDQTTHSVDFAQVHTLQVTEQVHRRYTSDVWVLGFRDGTVKEMSINDVLRVNINEISAHFAKQGIVLPKLNHGG